MVKSWNTPWGNSFTKWWFKICVCMHVWHRMENLHESLIYTTKLQRHSFFASDHFGLYSHTISMTTTTPHPLLCLLENMLMGRKTLLCWEDEICIRSGTLVWVIIWKITCQTKDVRFHWCWRTWGETEYLWAEQGLLEAGRWLCFWVSLVVSSIIKYVHNFSIQMLFSFFHF